MVFSASLPGPLKLSQADIQAITQKVVDSYPQHIAERVKHLSLSKASPWERCDLLRGIFVQTTQLVSLICISDFLRDEKTTTSTALQNTLSKTGFPYDSTWKETLIKLHEDYYAKSGQLPFIDKLPQTVALLANKQTGYEHGLTKKITLPFLPFLRLDILKAGVELRNAIAHDSSTKTDDDLERIFPYYQDIVFSLLAAFDFLDGSRYQLLAEQTNGTFEVLHGQQTEQIVIDPELLEETKDTDRPGIFLFDTSQDRLLPLYPFFIQRADSWADDREYIYERRGSGFIEYLNRHNKPFTDQRGYELYNRLMKAKKVELAFDYEKLSLSYLQVFGRYLSSQTLSSYLQTKYFPEAYVRRDSLEQLLEQFLVSDRVALLLTGTAGIGKSAFLADLAYRYREDNSRAVLFLNAREIQRTADQQQPVLNQLLDKLMLRGQNLTNIDKLLRRIDQLSPSLGEPPMPQVLLVIDAVNESFSSQELLEDIDQHLVSQCVDERWKRRYPWLKVIYSIRSGGLNVLARKTGKKEELLQNPSLYWQVPLPEQESREGELASSLQQTPFVEVPLLEQKEVRLVLNRYIQSGKIRLEQPDIIFEFTAHQELALGNPYYLFLYLKLLEASQGRPIDIGTHGERILEEYYKQLIQNDTHEDGSELKTCLHRLCHLMVEGYQRNGAIIQEAALPAEVVNEVIIKYFREQSVRSNQGFYVAPLERLEVEGLIQWEFRQPSSYEASEGYLLFTQQRFLEYVLKDYLWPKIGLPDQAALSEWLNRETNFGEYNRAISLWMQELWRTNRFTDLCRLDVTVIPNRYTDVFTDAVFLDVISFLNINPTKQELEIYESNWIAKIKKWQQQTENLLFMPKLVENLFWKNQQFFEDRKDAFGFYRYILDLNFELLNSTDSISYYCFMALLVTSADVLFETGDFPEAKLRFEKALEVGEEWKIIYPDDVDLKQGLSVCFNRLGSLNENLGNFEQALASFIKSQILCEELCIAYPNNRFYKNGLAQSYKYLGALYENRGNLDSAFTNNKKLHQIGLELYSEDASDLSTKQLLAVSYYKLGRLYELKGNFDDALDFYQNELKFAIELFNAESTSISFKHGLSVAYSKLGEFSEAIGNIDSAVEYFQQSNKLAEEVYNANPNRNDYKSTLAKSYKNLGNIKLKLNEVESALDNYLTSQKLSLNIFTNNSIDLSLKRDYVINYQLLGDFHKKQGNLELAFNNINQSLEIALQLYKTDPLNYVNKELLAISYNKLGEIYENQENLSLALLNYELQNKLSSELYTDMPDSISFKLIFALSHFNLSNIYKKLNNIEATIINLNLSYDLLIELYTSCPTKILHIESLVIICRTLGELKEEQKERESAFNYFLDQNKYAIILYNTDSKKIISLIESNINLARILEAEKDWEQCLIVYLEILKLTQENIKDNNKSLSLEICLLASLLKLGELYKEIHDFENAKIRFKELKESASLFLEIDPSNKEYLDGLLTSYHHLCNLYEEENELESALMYLKECIKLLEEYCSIIPSNPIFEKSLLEAYYSLGEFHERNRNQEAAETSYIIYQQYALKLYEENPSDSLAKHNLSTSYFYISEFHKRQGNIKDAIFNFTTAFKLTKENYIDNPDDLRFKNGFATSHRHLSELYEEANEIGSALIYLEEYIKILKEYCLLNPSSPTFKQSLLEAYYALGEFYERTVDKEAAEASYIIYQQYALKLYEENPSDSLAKHNLSTSYNRIGTYFEKLNNYDDALNNFLFALKLLKEICEEDPLSLSPKNELAIINIKLSNIYQSRDQWQLSLDCLYEANEIFGKIAQIDYQEHRSLVNWALSFENIATLFLQFGEKESAIRNLQLAVDVFIWWKKNGDFLDYYEDLLNKWNIAINNIKLE